FAFFFGQETSFDHTPIRIYSASSRNPFRHFSGTQRIQGIIEPGYEIFWFSVLFVACGAGVQFAREELTSFADNSGYHFIKASIELLPSSSHNVLYVLGVCVFVAYVTYNRLAKTLDNLLSPFVENARKEFDRLSCDGKRLEACAGEYLSNLKQCHIESIDAVRRGIIEKRCSVNSRTVPQGDYADVVMDRFLDTPIGEGVFAANLENSVTLEESQIKGFHLWKQTHSIKYYSVGGDIDWSPEIFTTFGVAKDGLREAFNYFKYTVEINGVKTEFSKPTRNEEYESLLSGETVDRGDFKVSYREGVLRVGCRRLVQLTNDPVEVTVFERSLIATNENHYFFATKVPTHTLRVQFTIGNKLYDDGWRLQDTKFSHLIYGTGIERRDESTLIAGYDNWVFPGIVAILVWQLLEQDGCCMPSQTAGGVPEVALMH
ncbi:MAG: hypothetical protein H7840_17200, partial [Alphaproteobacteria bacterium]